jgi:hypothetical protein
LPDKAKDMADAIDDYIQDVVSKTTGSTTVSTPFAPFFVPPFPVAPLDGGATLQAGMATKAATPLSGAGTITPGGLSTN